MNRSQEDPWESLHARVEARLRFAAEFEPTEDAPSGLADRALARRQERGGLRSALVLQTLCVAGLLALLAVWANSRGERAIHPVQVVAAPVNRPSVPVSAPYRRSVSTAKQPPHPRLVAQAIRRRRSHLVRAFRTSRRRRAPQLCVARPPRVHWRDETVGEYRSSMITPVLLVVRDEEQGTTVATPVMVTVPLASAEVSLAKDAPDEVQLTRFVCSGPVGRHNYSKSEEISK